MLLRLAYYGDPVLRKKARPIEKVDDALRQLIADMIETMHHHQGAGLAAPQVHQSLAVMLTYIPQRDTEGKTIATPERIFINPKLLNVGEKTWSHSEGCLSIPEIYEEVERPLTIQVETTTLEEERCTLELSGWEARAFLHENDHLNGVLFIDRVHGKRRRQIEPYLRAIKKQKQS
jgi:peptide deformylase